MGGEGFDGNGVGVQRQEIMRCEDEVRMTRWRPAVSKASLSRGGIRSGNRQRKDSSEITYARERGSSRPSANMHIRPFGWGARASGGVTLLLFSQTVGNVEWRRGVFKTRGWSRTLAEVNA